MERLIDINTYMWGPKSKQGKKDLDIQGIHTHAAQGMEEELGNKERKRGRKGGGRFFVTLEKAIRYIHIHA